MFLPRVEKKFAGVPDTLYHAAEDRTASIYQHAMAWIRALLLTFPLTYGFQG